MFLCLTPCWYIGSVRLLSGVKFNSANILFDINNLIAHHTINLKQIDPLVINNNCLGVQSSINWNDSDTRLSIWLLARVNSHSFEILNYFQLFPTTVTRNTFGFRKLIKFHVKGLQKLIIVLAIQKLLKLSALIFLMRMIHELAIVKYTLHADDIEQCLQDTALSWSWNDHNVLSYSSPRISCSISL